jgi:uncharacterized protein (DUF433 family)
MSRYPLNLSADLRCEAAELAERQGISSNQFILWSVAEKVGELRRALERPPFPGVSYRRGASGQPVPIVRGRGIRVQTIVTAARHWGLSGAQIAEEYGLTEREVAECLAFYAEHRAEVDAAIEAEARLTAADA